MNTDTPMVSIRCITYNHEPYIRQCLEGFVMQKTNFKFEAIVHDDASTDHTADIIREYAAKYPDIIKPIYETENQYSKHDGSIRRIMDAACTGKYMACCEGDDYWIDPFKLQKQVDFLEANPEYSVCSGGFQKKKDGILGEKIIYHTKKQSGIGFTYNLEDWMNKWYTKTLTVMYRANVLGEYREKYSKYKYARDVHLYYHILKEGKGYYFSECFGVYNIHAGGVCSMVGGAINSKFAYEIWREIYTLNPGYLERMVFLNRIRRRILRGNLSLNEKLNLVKEFCNYANSLKDYVTLFIALLISPKIIDAVKNGNSL